MAASVGAAVQWIGDQVVEEAKYLYRIGKKVEELQEELKWMSCFLQDVDARRDRDARMREWVKQISLLANESEDIIETFILKVEFRRRGGLLNKLRRCSCIIREAMTLHELGSDIDALTQRISKLTSRLQAYGITTIEQGGSWSVSREEQLRKSYAYHVEVDNIIGLDNDVEVVVNKLNSNESNIVALCGVGGLGKTTLAKKVYHHKYVRQYFNAFAWASISQQCDVRGVLTKLIQDLTSEKVSNEQEDEFLKDKLCKVQQEKKCLVVLDDIWYDYTWDSLRHAFQNPLVGKLMFTTRKQSVAKYADGKALIHEQEFMNEKDAQQLLKKKLQHDPSNIFRPEHGKEANTLAEEMLEHCGGLPLAIAALGGILAKKKSLEQWRTVHKNIKSVLPNAKEGGLSCNKVLSLSYYDLPFHLKPCFLYLGIFPEDTEIAATKVIELWMAEGFLSTDNLDNEDYFDEQGSNSMELGEAYLAELVDRSMVQVGSTRADGRIKSCRVHDLVRELCISKAAEENFLKVLAKEDSSSSSSSSIGMSTPAFTMNTRKRYRRFTVHSDDAMKKLTRFNAPLHVKSLYLWSDFSESSISIKAVIKQFRLLRVLDLDGIKEDILPKGVGELVHLRYLSLRHSWIRVVPSSIVKLKSLQTLDLRSTYLGVEWLPDMIWRMRQLRHVYIPKAIKEPSIVERIAYKLGSSKLHQKGGDRLNHNIEVLCNFDGLHRLKDVAELTKLRKLSIASKIKEKEGLKHIKNSKSLLNGCLKYLCIRLREELLVDEPSALCNFERLNKLKLEIFGRISSGSSSSLGGCTLGPNMLPPSLTTLCLNSTKIENPDAMQILEKLPNLRKLTFLENSYMGKEMRCSDGGFPKLIYLILDGLENLEKWTIEKGAMPSLLRLSIWRCAKLNTFPDGIKYIPKLKELYLEGMPADFRIKWREWKESAIERDDRDVKGGASGVEDGGLSDSDKVINHHIPTTDISDGMGTGPDS